MKQPIIFNRISETIFLATSRYYKSGEIYFVHDNEGKGKIYVCIVDGTYIAGDNLDKFEIYASNLDVKSLQEAIKSKKSKKSSPSDNIVVARSMPSQNWEIGKTYVISHMPSTNDTGLLSFRFRLKRDTGPLYAQDLLGVISTLHQEGLLDNATAIQIIGRDENIFSGYTISCAQFFNYIIDTSTGLVDYEGLCNLLHLTPVGPTGGNLVKFDIRIRTVAPSDVNAITKTSDGFEFLLIERSKTASINFEIVDGRIRCVTPPPQINSHTRRDITISARGGKHSYGYYYYRTGTTKECRSRRGARPYGTRYRRKKWSLVHHIIESSPQSLYRAKMYRIRVFSIRRGRKSVFLNELRIPVRPRSIGPGPGPIRPIYS